MVTRVLVTDTALACREETVMLDAFSMLAVMEDVVKVDVVREPSETRLFAVKVPLNMVL